MNVQTLFTSAGEVQREINVVRLSRTGDAVRPAGYVFTGVIAAQPEHVPAPRQKVDVQAFPAMRLEDYGAKFRRPSRERQKELNQGDPHYSPKSWFSAALKDKLGFNTAHKVDRLKHALALGRVTPQEYARRRESLAASEAESAFERDQFARQYAETMQLKRMADISNGHHKKWLENVGPATPQAKPVDAGEAQAWIAWQFAVATGAVPLRVKSNRSNSVSSIPTETKHGAVSNGMEARGAYGKGDMHNGNPTTRREEKALELAMLEMEVKKLEAIALELCGKPGGRKAHKTARAARHNYNKVELEFRSTGIMGRLHAFENSAARSTRGRNAAEKIKEEGRQARL